MDFKEWYWLSLTLISAASQKYVLHQKNRNHTAAFTSFGIVQVEQHEESMYNFTLERPGCCRHKGSDLASLTTAYKKTTRKITFFFLSNAEVIILCFF